jgi:hypothetical protein
LGTLVTLTFLVSRFIDSGFKKEEEEEEEEETSAYTASYKPASFVLNLFAVGPLIARF